MDIQLNLRDWAKCLNTDFLVTPLTLIISKESGPGAGRTVNKVPVSRRRLVFLLHIWGSCADLKQTVLGALGSLGFVGPTERIGLILETFTFRGSLTSGDSYFILGRVQKASCPFCSDLYHSSYRNVLNLPSYLS